MGFNWYTYLQEGQPDERSHSLYSRFIISGRDMAAFFVDGIAEEKPSVSSECENQMLFSPLPEDSGHFYSILDRSGMSVIVDQVFLFTLQLVVQIYIYVTITFCQHFHFFNHLLQNSSHI